MSVYPVNAVSNLCGFTQKSGRDVPDTYRFLLLLRNGKRPLGRSFFVSTKKVLEHRGEFFTDRWLFRSPSSFLACSLSGPIYRDIAILSLRYPVSRDSFFGRQAAPQYSALTPHWYLGPHRHICAIPHFATCYAMIMRYPTSLQSV